MDNNVLLLKADEYSALLDKKAEIKEMSVENNKAVEKCRNELAEMMLNEEAVQFTRSGYSFSLQEKVKWNKKAGKDDELFDVLRDNNLGDIIKETVNAATLNSTINNLVAENDDELPEEFDEVLSKYEYTDVSRRKSTKKL